MSVEKKKKRKLADNDDDEATSKRVHHVGLEWAVAQKLIDDGADDVVVSVVRRHLTLPWHVLGSARPHVNYILQSAIGRYSDKLQGMALSFRGVEPVDSGAVVYKDHPCAHLDVDASYVVFKPIVDRCYTGVVTLVDGKTVSLTIHRFCPAIGHRSGGPEGSAPKVGDLATIKITQVSVNRKMMELRGKIISVQPKR